MRKQIVDWYLQRAADDKAKLAGIRGRYELRPAASTGELLAQLNPEDAAAVREIMTHTTPGADAIGFDLTGLIIDPCA